MRRRHPLLTGGILAVLMLAPSVTRAENETAAPPWAASLRATVQLDPARGAELAVAEEARAKQAPASPEQKIAILTAQYYHSEALLQLNRALEATPIVEAAINEPVVSLAGKQLHGQFLLVRAGIRSDARKAAEALADFQAAYHIFVETHQPRNQAVALMGIGSIYQDAGDYNRVLYYYKLADEAYPGDALLGLSSTNNQGNALAELKIYREAERKYRRALSYAQTLKSPALESRILRNVALMQIRLGDLDTGEQTLARGLALSRSDASAKAWQPLLLGTAAQLEMARHRPAAAVQLIEQATAGMTAEALADQSSRDLHQVAYTAYKATGDETNALRHLEAFRAANDAGRALTTEANNSLLAARFDFANQNIRISSLKAGQLQRDVALARLQSRQNAILLGSLLALVTVVAIALALYLRALRRSRNSIRQANEQLSSTNIELEHALSVKSRFLATTSHEIRTPLNGVLGMTQVILADPALEPGLRDQLQLVRGAGEAMRQLVDDILEFARIDAGKIDVEKGDIDLHRLLEECVGFWQAQAVAKGLTLNLELNATPQFVFEDGRRVRQVIFNLLSNALKFTPTGAIDVVADVVDDGLVIKVRDTGIGIPAEAFPSIFEMFSQVDNSTTRQFSGSGLGLAISRSLAQALGGDLKVASTPGVGSVFTLQLPLVQSAHAAAAEAPPLRGRPADLADANLLLVGGTLIGQSVIASLVRDKVARIDVAPALEEARAKDAWQGFDIVIIDRATVADDAAQQFIDDVRNSTHALSIVILLRDGDAGEISGADSVIARPLTAMRLLSALTNLFDIVDDACTTVSSDVGSERSAAHAGSVR